MRAVLASWLLLLHFASFATSAMCAYGCAEAAGLTECVDMAAAGGSGTVVGAQRLHAECPLGLVAQATLLVPAADVIGTDVTIPDALRALPSPMALHGVTRDAPPPPPPNS